MIRLVRQCLVLDDIIFLTMALCRCFVDIYGNVIRQPASPALHVIDTTGAGDCFTGAFAVAMLEGKSDAAAMEWASEC